MMGILPKINNDLSQLDDEIPEGYGSYNELDLQEMRNKTINECQSAMDKAVDKAADVDYLGIKILACLLDCSATEARDYWTAKHWQTNNKELAHVMAQAISQHIKSCFNGKE